jgi:hypothetical protein
VCLSVFLVEKTVVPFLHQHHEIHSKVQGDCLQTASDCFACDLVTATLDAEQVLIFTFAFVLVCVGVLQLFTVLQQTSSAVIFSSLRAPPSGLTV